MNFSCYYHPDPTTFKCCGLLLITKTKIWATRDHHHHQDGALLTNRTKGRKRLTTNITEVHGTTTSTPPITWAMNTRNPMTISTMDRAGIDKNIPTSISDMGNVGFTKSGFDSEFGVVVFSSRIPLQATKEV